MSDHHLLQEKKYSGVTWIGDIPANWQVARIKVISALRNERRTELPAGALYIGLEDVEPGSGSYQPTVGSSRKSDDSTVSIFRHRDVLYGKLRPYLKKAIVAHGEGACSTEFLILDVESKGFVKPEWLHGWLLTQDVTQRIEAGCDGAKMPRASWEHISSIPVPFPAPEEQTEILEYLDGKTTRIDTLIAKKTRFIELLKEKRQAIITKAVTKGLDDSVEMKDSGVEWVGQTPVAWDVKRFKWSVIGCSNGTWGDEPDGSLDLVVVRVADFDRDRRCISLIAPTKRSITYREREGRLLKKGDLLIEKSGGGDNQPVGMVVIYDHDEEAVCSNFVAKMTPANGYDPHYLKFLHQAFYHTRLPIRSIKQSTGIQNLDSKSYLDEYAPFPTLEEQIRISKWLTESTSRIDGLILKTQRSIELLKEKRSALITAAVTGKIDVREAA